MPRDDRRRWRYRRAPHCTESTPTTWSEVQAADSLGAHAGVFGNCPEGRGNRRHLRLSAEYSHRPECARNRIVESLTGLRSRGQSDITCTRVAEASGGLRGWVSMDAPSGSRRSQHWMSRGAVGRIWSLVTLMLPRAA